MSIWSGARLEEELEGLITPFDPKRIDCAAYTLRVGGEIYISPESRLQALRRTRRAVCHGESFVIPSGQFGFLVTEEIVEVPGSALGLISMKARIKFKGLVNVSGFHVDPGYRGRLVFAVFNAGPSPVHLARGDDCFLIWYVSLDRDSTYVRDGAGVDGITSDLLTGIGGEVQSLAGLAGRIDAVEKEQRSIHRTALVAISVLGGLLATAVAVLVGVWGS